MLNIQLGTCLADNRIVDKTSYISFGSSVSCEVFHECSIMSPVFLLAYNPSYVTCNYVYVPDWHRYYFIVDETVAPGGRIYITCKEDVLMSNKDEILNLDAQLIRNEEKRNKLIVDNRYPAEIMSTLGVFDFEETPFDVTSGYNLVLTVIGGEHS